MKKSSTLYYLLIAALYLTVLNCASAPRYTDENLPPRSIFGGNNSHQKQTLPTTPSRLNPQKPTRPGTDNVEIGVASYMGNEKAGKNTANGEIYYLNQFTAAHKTLPFNTIVRVTNMENNKTVQVRINDRGPFKPNRIIDLSFRAAKELGMLNEGVALVRLEILKYGH